MPRKNLKVSEIVHEELEVRKRRDESFDDVLKRELGIIPSTVDELTTYYPEQLREAASYLADFFGNEDRYLELVTDHDDYFALNFDSRESRRTIVQFRFSNDPPWVDIYYRNERGELESAGQILQQEGDEMVILDVDFTRPDTGAIFERTDDFHYIKDDLEDALQSLQDASYERWG